MATVASQPTTSVASNTAPRAPNALQNNNPSAPNLSSSNLSQNNPKLPNAPSASAPNAAPSATGAVPSAPAAANQGSATAPSAAPAAAAEPPQMPRFAYTGSGYWGGAWYPYWTLMVLTILGGLLGLDHLWLRSPTTAMLKVFVNIFTLGGWWIYDIIQIFKDKERVLETGLSIPIIGAAGIGAGVFRERPGGGSGGSNDKEDKPKSPYRWLLYSILVFFPFGLDSFIAGDSMGAMVKFISTILIFMAPLLFIWKAIEIYYNFFSPQTIWDKGMYRFFPFNFIMDTWFPSKLGPSDPLPPVGKSGVLYALGPVAEATATVLEPVVNVVLAPVTAVTGAVTAAADVATVGLQSTSALMKAATTAAVPAVASASAVAQTIPGALPGLEAAASQAVGPQMASTEHLTQLANAQGIKTGTMVGGAALSLTDGLSTGGIIAVVILLLGGGLFLGGLRLKEIVKQKENASTARDDKPVEPSRLRGNAASS